MAPKEVAEKYALRRKESVRQEAACKAVDPTKQPTIYNFEVVVDGVQSTSKLFGTRV
jgi:hypothetical protein